MYVRRWPLISASSDTPPRLTRSNFLSRHAAIDLAIDVLPVPGGPTSSRIGGGEAAWGPAAALVLGVFLGSAGWWLVLAGGVAGLLRGRLGPARILWINRAAGVVIAGFGLAAVARGLGVL